MAALPQIFISYTQIDRPFVGRLADDLRRLNLGVWVDFWEIKVGDSLIERIGEGLSQADYVIAVISKSSAASKWVKKELSLALHRSISGGKSQVLPVVVDDSPLPDSLQDLVYADFSSYETGFEALLARIYPEAALQEEAAHVVRRAQELGHMLPEFFYDNAMAAIRKRLVPVAEASYATLLWGGMESWFEDNLAAGITSLTKWEQFTFLLDFAGSRFGEPEAGVYSIPQRFVDAGLRSAFDWERLALENPGTRRHAFFGQGPRRDVRFSHQAAIDLAMAAKVCLHLEILRDELAGRLPATARAEIAASSQDELDRRLFSVPLLRMIHELSRTDSRRLYAALDRQSHRGANAYGGANIVALLRLVDSTGFEGRDFSRLDLSHADFSSTNLARCSFRRSRLRHATFTGCNLEGADWAEADITDVNGILPVRYSSLCFTNDGRRLLAGGRDGSVRCFSVADGTDQIVAAGHSRWVSALLWDPRTQRVLSSSGDGTIRSAAVEPSDRQTLPELLLDWSTLAWDKAHLWWVMPHSYCVGQDEAVDMVYHFLRKKHPTSITCLAASARESLLAFGSYGGVLGVLDLAGNRLEVANMAENNNYGKGHHDTIWQVRFANRSSLLASAGGTGEGVVKVWDVKRRDLVGIFEPKDVGFEVRDIIFAGDDSALVGGTDHGFLCAWSAETADSKPIASVHGHDVSVLSLAIDGARDLLASGDQTGVVKLWDRVGLQERMRLKLHEGGVSALQFSADGGLLASAGDDALIKLTNTSDGDANFGRVERVFQTTVRFAGLKLSQVRVDDPTFLHAALDALRRGGAQV